MKILLPIILPLLLTSCSNPDTSGGVTLSKGADDANEFPHGSCDGPGKNPPDGGSGCGWITAHEKTHYIMPYAKLNGVKLNKVDLSGANLAHAHLHEAKMFGVILRGADLWYADLSYADLRYTDLSYADLRNADLGGADLTRAILAGTNL